MKRVIGILTLLVFCCTAFFVNPTPVQATALGDLKIHYIDVVAPSDAIVVELPDGKNMLIDCGHDNAEVDIVMNYLDNLGITTLDYVFGTHQHSDHIGGMYNIINNYTIGTYYQPDEPTDNTSTTNVKSALASKGMSITYPVTGSEVFNVNSGELVLKILGPNSSTYDDDNNFSIVLKLIYGSTSYIFTGDASHESEGEMIIEGYDLSADVLKIGHHGSSSSTSQAFLDAVAPTYAVIPCGIDRRPHKGRAQNPTKVVLDRLYGDGVDVFRVGEQGTIICSSDGINITFNKTDVQLSDYYYGGQLEENNELGTRENYLSNNSYTTVTNSQHFSKFSTGWTIKEGIIEDNEVVESREGGSIQIIEEGTNKLIELKRTGNEYVDPVTGEPATIMCEKTLDKPLIGKISVKADIRLSALPQGVDPDTLTAKMYVKEADGTDLVVAEFNSDTMLLRNYGSTKYPGAEAIENLNEDIWYTVEFDINTRTAKFDLKLDGQSAGIPDMNLMNVLGNANVGRIAFAVDNDETLFYVDNVSVSVEDYVFESTFEIGDFTEGWETNTSAVISTTYPFLGNKSAKLNKHDRLVRKQNTTGYKDISVDFAWRTDNLDANEYLAFEWSPDGGTTYYELSRIDSSDTGYKVETHYLPASADNNPDLRVRFRAYGIQSSNGMKSTSHGYVDNFYLRAVPN